MEVHIQDIENKTEFTDVQALVNRWRFLAGERSGLPDIAGFRDFLCGKARENLCVLKRAGSDLRYQSAGCAVSAHLGEDPTGRPISELVVADDGALSQPYLEAIRDGAPRLSEIRANALGKIGRAHV